MARASPSAAGQPLDFGILLNMAYGVFKRGLHEHLRQAGFDDLGTSFGYVLRALDKDQLNLKQVSQVLGITPQGALKVVEEMVAKGYVAREPDPLDARVKRLALTPRARSLLAQARKFHRRFESDLAAQLGEANAQRVRRALETLVARAEAREPVGLRPL